jgi:hypothetical protein
MNPEPDENEPIDHYELRFLLEEAKPIMYMSPDEQKEWFAGSQLAQEIYTILLRHPEYYEEFRDIVGGIFPKPN